MSDQPAIVVEGLVKHYGDVHALDGIDLTVRPGTVYGLLGPNGAGKTTAVRVLTTITPPDAGRVEVLGLDVVRRARHVRANIGLAGQYAAVDEQLTGRENLRLVGRLTRQSPKVVRTRADELLERFSLADAADRPVKTYSGGMRRRLDLAASLVHRPLVLFLDEPTTGLDPRSRNDLWDMIRELVADGTTLLLTTQYLEEADVLAERLAVIDHGLVIAEGTPGELKAQLGTTVLEVGFDDDASARAAVPVIGAIAPGGELQGRVLHITVDDGPKVAMEVLRALDQAQLAVGGLALREPSLDDVFLSLTGHRTEEPATDGNGDLSGPSEPERRPAATTTAAGGAA
jgi:ABC-2 type transport system ATP-binding protein